MTDQMKIRVDPDVTFGRFKGQGLKLSDLQDGYLKWLAHGPKDNGPIHHRGYNWDKLAQLEEQRRKRGDSPGVLYDLAEEGEVSFGRLDVVSAAVDLPGDEVKSDAHPDRLSPTQLPMMTIEGMNSLVRHFLREFIIRREKDQKLSDFGATLGREAGRNGQRVFPTNRTVGYLYLNKIFLFAWDDGTKNHILLSILSEEEFESYRQG